MHLLREHGLPYDEMVMSRRADRAPRRCRAIVSLHAPLASERRDGLADHVDPEEVIVAGGCQVADECQQGGVVEAEAYVTFLF
jgi:hypothetical protein